MCHHILHDLDGTCVAALQEYSDAMLSLMMSTITKGLYNVNELVDKFNAAYDKLGRRRQLQPMSTA